MATDVQERLYRLVVDGTQAMNQLKKIGKSTESIDNQFQALGRGIKTAMGFLAAGGIAKGILDNAEKLNTLAASLSVLRGGAEEGADAVRLVFDIVNETGASLDAVSDGFTRMSIGLKSLGANNDQIAQITENFIKLGKVGGASMDDINGALMQFGQALSSGVLQGDEFKAISERFPLLLDALAKDLGVATGELKKMASQGKLTSDVLANTLLKMTAQVGENFAKLPQTVDQSMNKIKASLAQLSQNWFNQSETGKTLTIFLEAVNDEIQGIIRGSDDWKGAMQGVSAVIKTVAKEVLSLVANMKSLSLAVEFLIKAPAMNWEQIKALSADLDRRQKMIEDRFNAQSRALDGTQSEAEKLALAYRNLAVGAGGAATLLEKPKSTLEDTGKAAKAAAKELEKVKSIWESMFAKVETPDEEFVRMAADLDKVAASGIASAEAIERVRVQLEKTRQEANEKLRVEQLTEFQKGWEAAGAALKKTGDEADQLKGKLAVLDQLRSVGALTDAYYELAASLGTSATAADQVAVAVKQVTDEEANTAALVAEFEKLKEAGTLSAEQLAKVKEALGNLGESKDELTAVGVAIGNTLSNSLGSFVDTLMDSEASINDWFANLFKQIGKLLIQMALLKLAKDALGGTSFGALFGFAQGGSFANGTGLPQGIYNSPHLFKFAHGGAFGRTGVLGEAGPEAVVPLKKTRGGDLGVQASPVNMTINNYTDNEVTVAESNKADGSKDIVITVLKIMKEAFADGTMDQSMRNNYNTPRVGR